MGEAAEIVSIAASLAPILTAGLSFYEKVRQNNQDSGLVPAETLFADALSLGKDIEATADAEIEGLTK